MDVERLARQATRLGIESYVLSALGPQQRRLGPGAARWLDDLRQRVASTAIENLQRDEELAEALALLEAEGIEVLLLKGAALRMERPDVAGRFQCDVDVLVRWRDLDRAESLLREMGFRLDESFLDHDRLRDRHFHFGYERRGAVVELHWDVDVASPEGFLDRLWGLSRRVERDGRSFRVPSPEHQLLFGCIHLSRHAFFAGLRWLADLRLLLGGESRARFAREAAFWPRRAAYCPLWMLACCGVPGVEDLAGRLLLDPAERLLLRRLLADVLMADRWMGLPAWRAAKALHEWLFSEEPLLPLLAGISREGIFRRLQSWTGDPAAGEAL